MKYNDNGEYKDIYIKTFDTLPVGAIVEYNGATIPDGWTDIGNNQIKKTSQYIEGGASISNVYGTSQSNGYSQEYINKINTYSTDEVRCGTWGGKPLYRKIIETTLPSGTSDIKIADNVQLAFLENGYFNSPSGNTNRYFTIPFLSNTGERVIVWCLGTGYVHLVNEIASYNDVVCRLIINYTKTTD